MVDANDGVQANQDLNHLDAMINELEAMHMDAEEGFPDRGVDGMLNKPNEEPQPGPNNNFSNPT